MGFFLFSGLTHPLQGQAWYLTMSMNMVAPPDSLLVGRYLLAVVFLRPVVSLESAEF
jgi:hypothetical protein